MNSDSPILAMRRALRKFSDAYAAEITARLGQPNKRSGELILTLPQYFTLRAIARFDSAPTQTDLVKETGIDRSTMATLIRSLRKKGYITRARCRTDARAYAIRVAEEGAKVVAAVKPIIDHLEATFLSHLSIRQREAFLAATQTLAFLDLSETEEPQKKAA